MEQRKIDDKDLKKVTGGASELELNSQGGGAAGTKATTNEPGNPGMPDEFDTDAPSGPGGSGTVDFNR